MLRTGKIVRSCIIIEFLRNAVSPPDSLLDPVPSSALMLILEPNTLQNSEQIPQRNIFGLEISTWIE